MTQRSDWRGALGAALVGLSLFARPAAAATGAAENLVQKGKYLATAADCASCHSPAAKNDYSGGQALNSPVGKLYAPNITPDPVNGIGTWTREQFADALRQGVRPTGESLYPAMPYTSYSALSDPDIDALWAYIHSLPAVGAPRRANALTFPFSVRTGLVVWKSLYFHPEAFQADARKDPAWNRGAYLVNVLGHCGECHTPRGTAQNLEQGSPLDGARIEGWYAPNISGSEGSVLAKWSVGRLEHYLATGEAGANAVAVGPMQEVIQDSLSKLDKSDLHAMAVYLKSQPAHDVNEAATRPGRNDLDQGKVLYADHCASCHGAAGKGSAQVPSLVDNDAVTAREPFNLYMAVLQGFPATEGHGAMGSFAATLNDDQVAAIANYVRQSWGNEAPANATAERVAHWRTYAGTPVNEPQALLCPNMETNVLQPATALAGPRLSRAEVNAEAMRSVVRDYRQKRPAGSEAEAVEALSTAYCRQLAASHVPQNEMSSRLASFAQRAAQAFPRGGATH